ncbi:type IX secretion system membrane protein PorP/SprF, partial [Bacteroidota bacterium]
LLFVIFSNIGIAQQDPQFSLNMFNHLSINPGFAGSSEAIEASAIIREQWIGFQGNPKTTVFSIHTPFKPFGINSGIGLNILDDKIGYYNDIGLMLSYSYKRVIGNGNLGIGINIGMLNKTIDPTDPGWDIPDSDMHTSASNDPAIPDGKETGMGFDMGLGGFYSNDKFYTGLSVTHLFQPNIDLGEQAVAKLNRHLYFTAGYSFQLNNPLFEIVPSILVKNSVSTQFDVNALVRYNKKYWGGVSYRLQDAIVVIAGMKLGNGLMLNIAYDFTTSDIRGYSDGSVEFMIGYSMKISVDKGTQKYKSVRYL